MTNKRQVGQISIRAGQAQTPANLRTIDSAATRAYRGRGDLLVLVEPLDRGVAPAAVIAGAIDQARDAYYRMGGSVTRGLRAAVLAANQALFEHNLRADAEHRLAVGIDCAAVRDDDLYLAQLGPTLAAVVGAGAVALYPPDLPWLRATDPGDVLAGGVSPAGVRQDVEPELYHHTLAADDVVVLAGTGLARTTDAAALGEALRGLGRDGALAALTTLAGGGDLDAVVLAPASAPAAPKPVVSGAAQDPWAVPPLPVTAVTSAPTAPAPEAPSGQEGDGSPWAAESVAPAAPEAAAPDPAAAKPVAPEPAGPAPVEMPSAPIEPAAAPTAPAAAPTVPAAPAGGAWEPLTPAAAPEKGGFLRRLRARAEAALPQRTPAAPRAAAPLPLRSQPAPVEIEPDVEDEDDWEEVAEEASPAQRPARAPRSEPRRTLGESAAHLRQSTETWLLRVLPDRVPERPDVPERVDEGISLTGRALAVVALIIPLLVLFIVMMTRIQYERTRDQQFTAILSLAEARYDAAIQIQDASHMRDGLREALNTINEGLSIDPADPSLNELKRRILTKLDEADLVQRLYHYWKLAEVEDAAVSDTDSSRIIIQGVDVFVINRGSDRVYKYMLNDVGDAFQSVDTNPVLMNKGDTFRGVAVGDLVDIAWMEAGGQRTLSTFVALESNGSLLAYDPQQGIDLLPVADSDVWLKPQAIGGYYGNLYVLDPLLNRILKYTPSDNIYTVTPSDYIKPEYSVDLTGAVDMAVDGNLYVLFADGQIKKFMDGQPQEFTMRGLPTPMRSPTTIFVSGEQSPTAAGHVYVTDTGNERIVEFDKQGNFIRQFQDSADDTHLRNLRGLYVNEARGQLFILSGRNLWLADFASLVGPEETETQ